MSPGVSFLIRLLVQHSHVLSTKICLSPFSFTIHTKPISKAKQSVCGVMGYDAILCVLVIRMAGRKLGTTEAVQGQVLHPPLLSLPIWHIQSYCRAVCGDEQQKGF